MKRSFVAIVSVGLLVLGTPAFANKPHASLLAATPAPTHLTPNQESRLRDFHRDCEVLVQASMLETKAKYAPKEPPWTLSVDGVDNKVSEADWSKFANQACMMSKAHDDPLFHDFFGESQ